MESTLLLQLAGPLQSWGSASRFNRRSTDDAPTKSGIVGLLAAASGRRRTDPVEDLAGLRLGVRIDQPGRLLRDYHTAAVQTGRNVFKTQLSERFYLSDAVFLAAVAGPEQLIDGLAEALRNPRYLLSLGRRSCVPSRPLLLGVDARDPGVILQEYPWLASDSAQRRHGRERVELETVIDCEPGHEQAETRNDVPISFDPVRRVHGSRAVVRARVSIPNPSHEHDPMAVL